MFLRTEVRKIHSFALIKSCSTAGRIFSIKSFVRSRRLDVLMQG